MHAKCRGELRFFAHDRSADSCLAGRESAAHVQLKAETAAAIRSAGWVALLEHAVGPRRVDVLATTDAAGDVAFEIQLSPQSPDVTLERHADIQQQETRPIWVVREGAAALGPVNVPRIEVRDGPAGATQVVDGLVRLRATPDRALGVDRPEWVPLVRPVAYARVVDAVLNGRLEWSPTTCSWLPVRELPEHGRLREVWDRAQAADLERRAREERELRRRDRERRRTTAMLRRRLEENGHSVTERDGGTSAAAGRIVTLRSMPGWYLVCPTPELVTRRVRERANGASGIVVPDSSSVAALAAVGLEASQIDELKLPEPPRIAVDRDADPTGALTRVRRVARWSGLRPCPPVWTPSGLCVIDLIDSSTQAVTTVGVWRDDEAALVDGNHCAVLIVTRVRDVARLSPRMPMPVVAAQQLTSSHLTGGTSAPVLPTAVHALGPPTRSSGGGRSRGRPPLFVAVDEIRALLPRDHVAVDSPLDHANPSRGRIVEMRDGTFLVVLQDAAPPEAVLDGAVVLYIGQEPTLNTSASLTVIDAVQRLREIAPGDAADRPSAE